MKLHHGAGPIVLVALLPVWLGVVRRLQRVAAAA